MLDDFVVIFFWWCVVEIRIVSSSLSLTQGSMPLHRAQRVHDSIDSTQVFFTRVAYMECLAALVAMYPEEVQKQVPGHNQSVKHVLHCATALDRTEWLFNGLRSRHSMPTRYLSLLPTGTASNESLHAEINGWFRQTHNLHQLTLKLKLRILQLSKLMSHNSAMYRPTLRQVRPKIVLARSMCKPMWTNTAWTNWCDELQPGAKVHKATAPLTVERKVQADKIRKHVIKRPSGAATSATKPVVKRPASKKSSHRTPLTRQRKGRLLSQGVRSKSR